MNLDLFGLDSPVKLNSKWNINSFVSNPNAGRKTMNTPLTTEGLSQDAKVELERTIKAIEMSYSKSSLDFDKIFRDLATRRKELKALMTELQATAKPVDIAALWGVESNLIVNQIRALENKQKIESEKFKQIRDEKKAIKDRLGTVEGANTNNGVTNIITNSPLANAQNLTAPNNAKPLGIDIGSITPASVVRADNKFTTVETIEHKEPVSFPPAPNRDLELEPIKAETTAEQTVMTTPSTPLAEDNTAGDVIVKTDILDTVAVTVNDIQHGINDRVMNRMANRDKLMHDANTMTGYNYQRSLDTLTTKSLPHKEKLFICPSTGTYYTKAFGKDENGNYTKEIPNFPLKSITHIGSIQLNPLHKQATFYYYPDPKEYFLVDNLDDMPDFYKEEWNNPKNEKFRLDDDTVNMLVEAEQ